ncbi:Os03g0329400 [Oryza sativa Japonica Group]|uniref:Os03g0329400 protein n=1 Tax=Oryza sativa subsp. japonica TaxID=39947 RepID=Q10LZ5_ORYSJ|nr:hypothetical protein LOC_Os03g21200 [Oryza sativa Japonica Group]BAS84018.1 Os03g0329400 [Oryza sativa Japonica Group]
MVLLLDRTRRRRSSDLGCLYRHRHPRGKDRGSGRRRGIGLHHAPPYPDDNETGDEQGGQDDHGGGDDHCPSIRRVSDTPTPTSSLPTLIIHRDRGGGCQRL